MFSGVDVEVDVEAEAEEDGVEVELNRLKEEKVVVDGIDRIKFVLVVDRNVISVIIECYWSID